MNTNEDNKNKVVKQHKGPKSKITIFLMIFIFLLFATVTITIIKNNISEYGAFR